MFPHNRLELERLVEKPFKTIMGTWVSPGVRINFAHHDMYSDVFESVLLYQSYHGNRFG